MALCVDWVDSGTLVTSHCRLPPLPSLLCDHSVVLCVGSALCVDWVDSGTLVTSHCPSLPPPSSPASTGQHTLVLTIQPSAPCNQLPPTTGDSAHLCTALLLHVHSTPQFTLSVYIVFNAKNALNYELFDSFLFPDPFGKNYTSL